MNREQILEILELYNCDIRGSDPYPTYGIYETDFDVVADKIMELIENKND